MNVKQLIEKLKTFDENQPVIIHHNGIYDIELYEGSLIGKPCLWLKSIPI